MFETLHYSKVFPKRWGKKVIYLFLISIIRITLVIVLLMVGDHYLLFSLSSLHNNPFHTFFCDIFDHYVDVRC